MAITRTAPPCTAVKSEIFAHLKAANRMRPAPMMPQRRFVPRATVSASLRCCSSMATAEDSAVQARNRASIEGRLARVGLWSFIEHGTHSRLEPGLS